MKRILIKRSTLAVLFLGLGIYTAKASQGIKKVDQTKVEQNLVYQATWILNNRGFEAMLKALQDPRNDKMFDLSSDLEILLDEKNITIGRLFAFLNDGIEIQRKTKEKYFSRGGKKILTDVLISYLDSDLIDAGSSVIHGLIVREVNPFKIPMSLDILDQPTTKTLGELIEDLCEINDVRACKIKVLYGDIWKALKDSLYPFFETKDPDAWLEDE